MPAVAMGFTNEVRWGVVDFAVLGAMLVGALAFFELATRTTGSKAYRAAVGVAAVAALLLVWINLAVGIIGSEDNPANLMYVGVLAILIVGALIAGFRPRGMSRTLVATALAQVMAGVVALICGWGSGGENWPRVIFVLNGFFAALWLGSAWLFQRAGRN
jgi:peptidoglycan/LPS O-acetylase OafA/YrhL